MPENTFSNIDLLTFTTVKFVEHESSLLRLLTLLLVGILTNTLTSACSRREVCRPSITNSPPRRRQDDQGVKVDGPRGVEARAGRQGGRCRGATRRQAGGAGRQGRGARSCAGAPIAHWS
jgi:hypothetical protein